jgi:DNA-binding transcriptional regulator LsrR (DeoR family)
MSEGRLLLAKVADLYYLQDRTQQEIADRLGLSRPTVSRLLHRARTSGIVRIEVMPGEGTHRELERAIEDRFGLREAIVVTGRSESPAPTRRALGEAAAGYLRRILKGDERIGISWGTTVAAVVDSVKRRAVRGRTAPASRIEVVPLVGGVGQGMPGVHANELARRLGDVLGGRVHLLHAPAVVSHRSVRGAMLSDPGIRTILGLARAVDIALVGIGALVPSSTLVRSGCFSTEELGALRRRGAVGDICTRAFTRSGEAAHDALDRRILAVELDDLRRIRTVIGAAGGLEKAEAIAGALAGRLVDVLVTDHLAARAVLRMGRSQPAQAEAMG